jgi:serine/threonine protein kinase
LTPLTDSFITLNSIGTTAAEYMKEKRDDWRITPFQALNFEVAAIPQGLTEENLVGSGGSGHVYRVTYTNRYNSSTGVVAVKQIRSFGSLDEKLEREFESEARILCNIRHNNIVKLLCCLSSAESKLLVYDYMDNGSLDRWLHGDYILRAGNSLAMARPVQRVPLDWPTRLLVAVGAAQGLCYMHHECSPPIVHRDIKTSNILLDSEFRAKIADFGVARMLVRAGEPNTMSAVAGSFGYMAPGKVLFFFLFGLFRQISLSFCPRNWGSSYCGFDKF